MTNPIASLRKNMPVSRHYAYFDHAAVAPLPLSAARAMAKYAFDASRNGDTHWLNWSASLSKLRSVAAQLIGASTEEIALVNNTTQGINLVAEGFPWNPGDNVVVPENEFPSNLLPWRNLARRGVEIRLVPVGRGGEITVDAVRQAIDSRSRLVAISWVGFLSGYRIDVAQITELAHSQGCLLMLDAIQGLGAFPLDVSHTGVDFLCADGHKWMLGPEGAGILYVRQEHLNLLTPLGLGWGSLAAGAFDPNSIEIKTSAARYEGGSYNMAGMIGFGASLELLHSLGSGDSNSPVASAILSNVANLTERLQQAGFTVHVQAQATHRSGIVGISWPEADAIGEQAYLEARKVCLKQKIVLSVRGGRLRASTHAYNNEDDLVRLVDALIAFRS